MEVVIDEGGYQVGDIIDGLLSFDWEAAVGNAPGVLGGPFEGKRGTIRCRLQIGFALLNASPDLRGEPLASRYLINQRPQLSP